MTSRIFKYLIPAALLLISCIAESYGQLYPERRLIRLGNKDYEKGDYVDSEIDYRRALEKAPYSYEAEYNLGNSLYKQGRFEEAAQIFSRLAQDSLRQHTAAHSHYNAGNSLFQQRKLEEALEEYKNSLRKNPNDMEAKFNLAYVKKLLEKDDDEDDNQDDDKKDNSDNNNDSSEGGNNGGNDDKPDEDENGQQPPPSKDQPSDGSMSREEADQMLEAIQMNEDRTREKVDEKKAAAVQKSDKNW